MKKLVIIFLLFCTQSFLKGQSHEISIGTGFAYYFGDLNVKNTEGSPFAFIAEAINGKGYKLSYSLGYRYSFKEFFSVGLNYYQINLSGYDSDNKSTSIGDNAYIRQVRNLSFHTAVNQAFLDFRYEPLRTNQRWKNREWFASPYVGVGLGLFKFNPKTMYQGQEIELQPIGTEGQGIAGYGEKYRLTELSIPVNLGVKFSNPNRTLALSLDFNYTFTNTDYLDDVSTTFVSPSVFNSAYSPSQASLAYALSNRNTYAASTPEAGFTTPGNIRGNPDSKDHFMTGQVKLSWYFLNLNEDAYYKCCGF